MRGPVTLLDRPATGTVSVTSAARILGVHPNTVRAWTDQGRLPCLRINTRGDRRYLLADLEAFLQPDRPAASEAPAQAAGMVTSDRRATELRCLAEVARLTARQSDLDATLSEVAALLRRSFGYRMVAISAVSGEVVRCRAAAGVARRRLPPMRLDAGLSGAALHERRPILAGDVLSDPRYVQLLPEVRSEIVVPILIGHEPWGVLVASDHRPGALLEMDLELLTTVSHQLGAAAERARLMARVQRQLHQAEALRRISADISSKLELSRILEELVDQAMVLFGADRAAVLLRHADGTYTAPVVRGLSQAYLDFVRAFPRPSLSSEALTSGRARFVVDYAHDPRGAGVRPATRREGFDTVAAAPLIAGAEVLGLLNLYHDRPHPWDSAELDTLEALAGQASIAISNAGSYAQTATWAAQLQSIQQLGTRLNRLATVQEVGWAICSELNQLIDYHNVRVYRVEGEDVLPVAWRGEIGEYTGEVEDQLKLKVGGGITGWVAAHGVAQYLPDAGHDARAATIPGTSDDIEESMLLAPMRYDDRVLGVIVLSKLGLHQFGAEDLRLLEIYASFAAQAVSNADATERLQAQSAALERRIRSQGELLRITETMLTQLDPRVVLDEIVERLSAIVAFDNLVIDVHDEVHRVMRPLVARGIHADLSLSSTTDDHEALTGWVVQHAQAALVPDELADPRVRPLPEIGPQAGSLMAVPLRGRDGISGVLTLERLGEGRVFTGEEFELVQLFAAQASIAMQNAEAYHHVELRARTDGLTGLSNHTTFREALARAVAHEQRFSLLMLDLDDFKDYNDSFGHPAGDELLQGLATVLRGAIREADSVYRYGGDEFAFLLPGTDTSGALHVADKIRQAVGLVRAGSGAQAERRITCSIGLATFPPDGTSADELLLAADRAAYASKRGGRDRVTTAEEARGLPDRYVPSHPTPVDQPDEAVATIA
ncbi:MAG TPA: GAF domain-containing protein [Candidatus Limnocylindrales bacterium]|nr:GAF domain-containing protein [Candidatus Limnocylindrales bacterium]